MLAPPFSTTAMRGIIHLPLAPKVLSDFALHSWGLSYNLYGDKLLNLNLFPQSVYQMREYHNYLASYGMLMETM